MAKSWIAGHPFIDFYCFPLYIQRAFTKMDTPILFSMAPASPRDHAPADWRRAFHSKKRYMRSSTSIPCYVTTHGPGNYCSCPCLCCRLIVGYLSRAIRVCTPELSEQPCSNAVENNYLLKPRYYGIHFYVKHSVRVLLSSRQLLLLSN